MNTIDSIYARFYTPGSPLYLLLRTHSELVGEKALRCADARNLHVDREFLYEAALLHDIGIFRTNAPGILCIGDQPYIRHGVIGRDILDSLGMPRHALVCERHTGAGLSIHDIIAQDLPLPHRDMCPVTLEEKLICYADKFYSKSGDFRTEKSLPSILRSMQKYGEETVARFLALHNLFG